MRSSTRYRESRADRAERADSEDLLPSNKVGFSGLVMVLLVVAVMTGTALYFFLRVHPPP